MLECWEKEIAEVRIIIICFLERILTDFSQLYKFSELKAEVCSEFLGNVRDRIILEGNGTP